MTAILVDPALDHRTGTRGKGAFERNLLPGFTRWFIEQVKQFGPDYLMPVETKGARVLDGVLDYALRELGYPIRVPVLYGTALAYIDHDTLRSSRVMVVDDAVRTGGNLERHRRRVESYGAIDVYSVACVGCLTESGSAPPARCYRLVDADLYREYVWQLTELVVARGLPPEVDHHVFVLELPGRLPVAWETLKQWLGPFGELTLDGPLTTVEEILSMTLHFPTMPGITEHPSNGDARDEGVRKLRFFADRARNRIYVVPVSFPALDLPAEIGRTLDQDSSRALIRRWTERDDSVGEMLVSNARTRDPEMLFRALSTCTEVDLVCGLARVLGTHATSADVAITAQRELFHRLYGYSSGESIAAYVDATVRSALQPSPRERALVSQRERCDRGPLGLDVEVVSTTARIAKHLKELYDGQVPLPDAEASEPVGESLSDLQLALNLEGQALLVSRCVDFGLAMTTLVPYTHVTRGSDGRVRARRKYRVSELNRDPEQPYEDIDAIRRQISEETLAMIAHNLRARSPRFTDSYPSPSLVSRLAAILRPLVLDDHQVVMRVANVDGELLAVLREKPQRQTVVDVTSQMFSVRESGIVPSAAFEERYGKDTLRLDRRNISGQIESYLELLIDIVDRSDLSEDERETLLTCWAMSTDERLGLSFVESDLEHALNELERLLSAILREDPHPARHESSKSARVRVDSARATLALLAGDWGAPVPRSLMRPLKRERQVLGSLGASSDYGAFFELVDAVATMIGSIGLEVQDLHVASATDWTGNTMPGAAARASARAALIERVLTSATEEGETTHLPDAPRLAITAAAKDLYRVIGILRAFVAASALSYRGSLRGRAVVEHDDKRLATILFADLGKSTKHALQNAFEVNYNWKDRGLNLIAQWGKAFGGREMKDRSGDDVWLEFSQPGNPAVLCATVIQQHAAVLRSTGSPLVRWGFHIAVDAGKLQDGAGGNVIGLCIDRPANLAKAATGDASLERTVVTPEAIKSCSSSLRDGTGVSICNTEVDLAQNLPDVASKYARFVPYHVDAERSTRVLAERIAAVALAIAAEPRTITDEAVADSMTSEDAASDTG